MIDFAAFGFWPNFAWYLAEGLLGIAVLLFVALCVREAWLAWRERVAGDRQTKRIAERIRQQEARLSGN